MTEIELRKQRWLDFQKPDTTVPFLFMVNAWEENAPVPQWGPPTGRTTSPPGARVIFDNIPAAPREEGQRICETLNQLREERK